MTEKVERHVIAADLGAEVIHRHQEIGGESVCLLFDDPARLVFIIAKDTGLAALKPCRIELAMDEIMSKLVRQREVDSALGPNLRIVEDGPIAAPGKRLERTLEIIERRLFNGLDRVGKAL